MTVLISGRRDPGRGKRKPKWNKECDLLRLLLACPRLRRWRMERRTEVGTLRRWMDGWLVKRAGEVLLLKFLFAPVGSQWDRRPKAFPEDGKPGGWNCCSFKAAAWQNQSLSRNILTPKLTGLLTYRTHTHMHVLTHTLFWRSFLL